MEQTIKNPTIVRGTFLTWGELLKMPGVYKGNWGGYEVTFRAGECGVLYSLKMDTGVRTPFSPCTVTIHENGDITVKQ